jgi:superfamily II DNA or RNA helicase
MVEIGHLESAIWAIADGRGTDADRALLQENGAATQLALAGLIAETEDDLAAVRNLQGEERDQVVADFTESLNGLLDLAEQFLPTHARRADERRGPAPDLRPPDEVVLQASWSAGQIVVWAAARGATPESNDELSSRLEAAGGPPHGWDVHPGIPLPNGEKAEALAIHVKDALGWLVAICGEREPVGLGPSLLWLSRAALEGVRLAARGSIVPKLDVSSRADGRSADARVRWVPALTDAQRIEALAAAMPRTVTALSNDGSRNTTMTVVGAVIETIVTQSVERMDLPAQPPRALTPTDLVDTIVARMDGAPFPADRGLAKEMARRLDQWTRAVADPRHQPLVVRLDPPATQGVWMLSVQVRAEANKLIPVATALRSDTGRTVANEWARLEKMFPPLRRADPAQRGQVALGQDEAWEFMSRTGAMLAAIGFDVRAPQLSLRPARPALHMFTEVRAGSTVGANQLSNVRWSVVFDDVELTAAEIARLAKQARPMVQSRGAWVEIDRLDLERAAEALAEREQVTQLTGAEILRQSMGIDAALGGAVVVHGDSWAKDIVNRAQQSQAALDTTPERFSGTLRSYQAEALAWIAFLDASELGGCLALDMGLGKTPTVLAHLARTAGQGASLVIAPAAVVGNWAAEAARFAPDLRVLVHHGASRASDAQLEKEISVADVVITTYATAVRDVDAMAKIEWRTMVLDEAQAIKNPASDTAQQLRRLNARTKLCLTGTPIENGVGDLWAILDFTNPGLVGPRPVFVSQMSGDGESALRALNGVLLFRRTKAEPEVAAELPDKIDELDHCTMTPEQIGLYQAVLDELLAKAADPAVDVSKGAVLAAITALKQICNHPAAYHDDGQPLAGRSGKLTRLEEIVESVFAAGERILIFTHFATWGRRLAKHLSERFGKQIECYDGDLSRTARDRMVADFQNGDGAGALVLSLKAGGTGLNLTAANHVILYDRWWNPAIEDQARDRAWRIGQNKTVISHRLVCPGTIDERVEEVVQGKRHIAGMVLPKSSSINDLDVAQLSLAFGLRPDELLTDETVSEEAR